jgi:hypothetical protein
MRKDAFPYGTETSKERNYYQVYEAVEEWIPNNT